MRAGFSGACRPRAVRRRATFATFLGLVLSATTLAVVQPPAHAALVTLFSNIVGPQTVTGADSVPVGPVEGFGDFRAAMPFTPTVSGPAQLLSIRGRCVGLACANIGTVSIQADVAGKPSGVDLGTMGFYLLEATEGAWRVKLEGNPTGGTFRLRYTQGSTVTTTVPIAWNAKHPQSPGLASFEYLQTVLDYSFGGQVLTNGQFPANAAVIRGLGSGTLQAVDVQLTGGDDPSVSVTQPQIEQECGTLSPQPQLTAGTKYWAVMSAQDSVGWDAWTNTPAGVQESVGGGGWQPAFVNKTLALRIDTGADQCLPVAVPNPDPGTTLGDMYVRTGAQTFNTVTITNTGVAPLTLGRVGFSGPDAGVFSVKDLEPGPLAQPMRFPRNLGVESLDILYVTCTGGATERFYRATMTVQTSDPDVPSVSYPVECLVDNTPPTVAFNQGLPDGEAGWWRTSPVTLGINGLDPESGNRVTLISCGDDNVDGPMSPAEVFGSAMSSSVAGEGTHHIGCIARDVAKNQSGTFATTVKVDSRPPSAAPTVTPAANGFGWHNSTPVSVAFDCEDLTPGSGVATEATGGATVSTETAGTAVVSGGCTDIAGNTAAPTTVDVKIDTTDPTLGAPVVTPAPNVAGWSRSALAVSFPCADNGVVQSGINVSPPDVVVVDETAGREIVSSGRCADRAGNDDPTTSSVVVKLDLTDPTTSLVTAPADVTQDTTAVLGYSGADELSGVVGFQCRLDDAAYAACADGQQTYGDLADGPHTFDVRAVDAAGNVDGSPASAGWLVDTLGPDTELESAPPPVTGSTSADFTYSADGGGGSDVSGFECSLDGAAFDDCPDDGADLDGLAGGSHEFRVRAVDEAGNADATPAVSTWQIDLTAPATTISSSPPPFTAASVATFAFAGVDSGGSTVAAYECRVDDDDFAPCSSPAEYFGLDLGPHTFEVRATDGVGNVEATPAAVSWTVSDFFAQGDEASTLEDTPMTVDVLGNDVTPDGMPVTVTLVGAQSGQGGSLAVNGSGAIVYSPSADYHGPDTFSYRLTAGGESTDPATVAVDVGPVNDAPTFTPGGAVSSGSGAYQGPWATVIRPGPANESGQQVHFVLGAPSDPSLFASLPQLSPSGVLSFTPASGAAGTTVVPVRLVDDGGTGKGGVDASPPVPLTITVEATDAAPTLVLRPWLHYAGGRGTLALLVHDDRAAAPVLTASASKPAIDLEVSGDGAHRRVTFSGLEPGTRTFVTLRLSDGVTTSSLRLRVALGTADGESVRGTDGVDVLVGLGGADLLLGGADGDLLSGGGGDDVVRGGSGDDLLRGGPGRDRLVGGPGDDVLNGGPGQDEQVQRGGLLYVPV